MSTTWRELQDQYERDSAEWRCRFVCCPHQACCPEDERRRRFETECKNADLKYKLDRLRCEFQQFKDTELVNKILGI